MTLGPFFYVLQLIVDVEWFCIRKYEQTCLLTSLHLRRYVQHTYIRKFILVARSLALSLTPSVPPAPPVSLPTPYICTCLHMCVT
jgi:hypothetical protein